MLLHRYGFTISLLFLLVGCSNERRQSSVSVRDSAGVSIIESSTPRWVDLTGWTIESDPIIDLAASGTGPSHEFHRVADATLLPDGTIAVADGGSSEVRFYSSTGTFLRAVGKDGEGPGEFRRIVSVERYRGDSIIAFDLSLQRATVFPIGDGVPRVIRLGLPFVWEVQTLDDGTLVAMLVWPSVEVEEGEAGLVRMPVPVVHFSPTGEVIDTVVMSSGHEEVRIPGENGPSSARALFGKQSHIATDRESIYLGSADFMQFEVYGATGSIERIVRVPGYDLSLSSAELDAERAIRMGDNPSPQMRSSIAALPEPQTRPAYSELLVDSEGSVWARRHEGEMKGFVGRDPKQWEVFSVSGEWLGRVQSPARFTVLEIGEDYVLGIFRDELDVEHVQLLRLHRS
jgi:hypothetical protein